ncbi:MAG: hypothetical protein P8Z71_02785 [Candidatus Sulfobium sp.]
MSGDFKNITHILLKAYTRGFVVRFVDCRPILYNNGKNEWPKRKEIKDD